VIHAKVIDLPKEGLTAEKLEKIINDFIAKEQVTEIITFGFNSEYGFLIIIYSKG
jgi:hypothetical protein